MYNISDDYVIRFYYYGDSRLASVSEGGAGPYYVSFNSFDKAHNHYLALQQDDDIATVSLLDNRDFSCINLSY